MSQRRSMTAWWRDNAVIGWISIVLAAVGIVISVAVTNTAPSMGQGIETSPTVDHNSPDPGRAVHPTSTVSVPIASSATLEPAPQPRYLADLQPTGGGMLAGEWVINQTTYPKSLGVESLCGPGEGQRATYDLGGKYRRFRAVVGGTSDVYENSRMVFTVTLDGREIARRVATSRQPAMVDVDISGGRELYLFVAEDGNCIFRGVVVWGGAQLIP